MKRWIKGKLREIYDKKRRDKDLKASELKNTKERKNKRDEVDISERTANLT